MYMATVFTIFALIAGALGLLMPHLVHRIGFVMMLVYLGLAAASAVIALLRPRPG